MALYESTGRGEPLLVTPLEELNAAMPHLAPLTNLASFVWEQVAAGNTAQFPGYDARIVGGNAAVLTQHFSPTHYVRQRIERAAAGPTSIVHERQMPLPDDEALGGFERSIARYPLDGTTAKTLVTVIGRLHEDGTLRLLEGEELLTKTYDPISDETCQKLLLALQAVTREYPLVVPRNPALPARRGWLARALKLHK
ncbi:MAG TPA: hypothetical protein VLF43_02140 [Candidatus Saccharimonadales bacterium]|nr:hypothetical protein [Candidatus Saccharimonadales bacterium]